jgi:hypothetical protein
MPELENSFHFFAGARLLLAPGQPGHVTSVTLTVLKIQFFFSRLKLSFFKSNLSTNLRFPQISVQNYFSRLVWASASPVKSGPNQCPCVAPL